MNKKIQLSIVVPAYRETVNVKRGVLEEMHSYLKNQDYSWEVLIVDDGSPDSTADEIQKKIGKWANFKLLREPHRGKGGTVIAGLLAASGERILFTDMDQATPLSEIEKFFPLFDRNYDVIIGSRSGRPGEPPLRKLMAYGFLVLRAIILRLPYKDTQCGFKVLTHEAAQKITKRMKIFSLTSAQTGVTAAFDLELLYVARKLGFKIAEVPVNWKHVGSVRVSPFKDSWLGLKGMVQVRLNALAGKYKAN